MSSLETQDRPNPPSREERERRGADARRRLPLEALAEYDGRTRPDPVAVLEAQARDRVQDLVPVRYGRMAATEFTFYRGAAAVMAADLARPPDSDLRVMLCGDAHLSNFGIFGTPERKLAFDVNDFDETHPGPFEWDVKRLAASLTIAAQASGFSEKKCRRIVRSCAAEYRETIAQQAQLGAMATWYAHIEANSELKDLREVLDTATRKRTQSALRKASRRTSEQALRKLTTVVNGERRIVSDPPLIVPVEELFAGEDLELLHTIIRQRLTSYAQSLRPEHRQLLAQFRMVQIARKVVGVGSVGTRTWVVLLVGTDGEPLFLQVKEAMPSVLAEFAGGPSQGTEGERVVNGQRLLQATSDIFLGWHRGPGPDGVDRDFYIRQLRDGKGSAVVETMSPEVLAWYGRLCGRALAYGHARSGDRIAIAAYLGVGPEFDHAIADFAESYSVQNTKDHAALLAAIASGRVVAHTGI